MEKYFISQLDQIINQTITIIINNSSSDNKISGVLISVNEDYISVVTYIGKSVPLTNENYINFNKMFPQKNRAISPGIIVDIPICKIAAVIRYAI